MLDKSQGEEEELAGVESRHMSGQQRVTGCDLEPSNTGVEQHFLGYQLSCCVSHVRVRS
jgi:hypothetical protein